LFDVSLKTAIFYASWSTVFGGLFCFHTVDGRDSFCVVSRRITPDWPQASMFIRTLQQGINGTKYQEPTQEMVSRCGPVPM
jgi:hypothetical protein